MSSSSVNNAAKQHLRHRRRICLFGTSANPPTGIGGHVGIVKALSAMQLHNNNNNSNSNSNDDTIATPTSENIQMQQHQPDDSSSSSSSSSSLLFDEIRVLPVYRHMFSSKRNQLVEYHHRIRMCELAFSNIPNVQVSKAEQITFERLANGMSDEEKGSLRVGTADLLEMLLKEEPDVDFSFCLGADTFADLTQWKWKRSKDVFKLLQGRLIVLYRHGIFDITVTNNNGDSDTTTTNITLEELVDRVNQTESAEVKLLRVPDLNEVSSSAVRECNDEEQLKTMISKEVLDYIKSNRLYAFMNDDDNDDEQSPAI